MLYEEDDDDRSHQQVIATSVDPRRAAGRLKLYKWMVEDEDYFHDLLDEGNRRRLPSSANRETKEAEDALEPNPLEMVNRNLEVQ